MKKNIWIAGFLLVALAQPVCRADTLQQVVIVTRHGVRAPTWTAERLRQYSTEPWPDFGVPPGNLTPHGRALMKIMGSFYRELYASSGLLAKSGCDDTKRIYFWADTDQRTLESARALAEGLMAGCKVEVHSKEKGTEDPLFDPITAGIAKPDDNLRLAAVYGRIGPRLDAVIEANRSALDLLQRVLNGDGKSSKSIFDEPITLRVENNNLSMTGALAVASTFTENLLLEYANGFTGAQFGWGRLNTDEMTQLLALHTAYAELMRRTPCLARARGSNLFSYIVRSMEQAATGKAVKGAALIVISGHDTNISNLSGMLGLSWIVSGHQPDDVPPGGALIFSLWKSPDGKYSVRVQFVVQTLEQMARALPLNIKSPPLIANLFVPGCSNSRDGYPCSWSSFKQLAKTVIAPEFVEPESLNKNSQTLNSTSGKSPDGVSARSLDQVDRQFCYLLMNATKRGITSCGASSISQ